MSPESRALLDLVRDAEDPTPDDEQRVLAAVRAAIVAGTAVGGASMATAAKTSKLWGLSGLSALKVAVTLLGLTGGTWLVGASWPESRAEQRPTPAAVLSASARPSSPPDVPPTRATLAASAEPAGVPAPLARKPRAAAPRSESPVTPPPSLREEIALLADVQRALDRGDGAAALGLLERHVTSDRQLAAERSAARVHALCALGRVEEARRAALEFVHTYPTSLQRAALERSCAGAQPGGER